MLSLIMNSNFVTVEIKLIFNDRFFPTPAIVHVFLVTVQKEPAKQVKKKKQGQQVRRKSYSSEQKRPNHRLVNTTPSYPDSTAIQFLVMSR